MISLPLLAHGFCHFHRSSARAATTLALRQRSCDEDAYNHHLLLLCDRAARADSVQLRPGDVVTCIRPTLLDLRVAARPGYIYTDGAAERRWCRAPSAKPTLSAGRNAAPRICEIGSMLSHMPCIRGKKASYPRSNFPNCYIYHTLPRD